MGVRFSASRLERERLTMSKMVALYCAAHHGAVRGAVCADCDTFLDYANTRLGKCPYGEEKPTCANCPVHCYKAPQREYAREVMRYAGPRMLLRHPILAVLHLVDGRRKAVHPKDRTRAERLRSRKP